MRCDCKGEPHIHAAAVVFDRRVEELFYFRKRDDLIEFRSDFMPTHPENRTVEKDVFVAGKLGMEAGANFEETCHPTAQAHPARGGFGDAAQNLEQRALTGTVSADDSDHLPAAHVKTHVLEGPEFLDLVT